MLDDLIAEIDAHLAWREAHGHKLAETTLGLRAVNDGKLVRRIREGGQITMGKAEALRSWMKQDRRAVAKEAAQDHAA